MELIVAKSNGTLMILDLVESFEYSPLNDVYEVSYRDFATRELNVIGINREDVLSFYVRRQYEQNTNL